jgi:hypothetical protein
MRKKEENRKGESRKEQQKILINTINLINECKA